MRKVTDRMLIFLFMLVLVAMSILGVPSLFREDKYEDG